MVSSEGIEKALADIASLQKDGRSIKARITKLTGRIDQLELLGLQEQVSSVGDGIKALKASQDGTAKVLASELLRLTQLVYSFKINSDVGNWSEIINSHRSDTTEIISQLLVDAKGAKSRVNTSSKPSDVYNTFKKKWDDKISELGINIITF